MSGAHKHLAMYLGERARARRRTCVMSFARARRRGRCGRRRVRRRVRRRGRCRSRRGRSSSPQCSRAGSRPARTRTARALGSLERRTARRVVALLERRRA